MLDSYLWHEDKKIPFLIKTLKYEFLDSTMKGSFCFNYPHTFNSDKSNTGGQNDRWDSQVFRKIREIVIAECHDDGTYGPVMPFADEAVLHKMSWTNAHTPFCCFRKAEPCDFEIIDGCIHYHIEKKWIERIKTDFKQDRFIVIFNPEEFIRRFEGCVICRSIHYGFADMEFEHFLKVCPLHQKEMFQKGIEYAWQKEFRIISPFVYKEVHGKQRRMIDIGSIEDIADCGNIDNLEDLIIPRDISTNIIDRYKEAVNA